MDGSRIASTPPLSWVLDFGDPCAAAELTEEVRGRVRAQQVLAVTRMTSGLMLANIVNACALVIVLGGAGQLTPAAGVWAVIAVALALHTLLATWRRRPAPFPESMRKAICHRVVRSAALFGIVWTIPGLFFLPATEGTAQAFVAALVVGMIGGGALALHPIPAAAIVYLVAVAAGGLLGLARTGDAALIGFILIALTFFYVLSRNILRHSEIFVSELVARLALEEQTRLIARLLDETRSAASEDRRRSEHRLAQAQKMEAIGQLTGGIAHDFNNLLAAIQGHAELIEMEGKADRALVAPITGATMRGSEFVQRLLTIARKQALKAGPVAVGRLLGDMVPLLRPLLNARIEIRTRIEGPALTALADPAALESAVLNLALNARDAMPEGGKLELACRNARAASSGPLKRLGVRTGEFIEIAVRDDGCGMTPEISERALEPFFTTKRFGDGSGLGLATVFGFAQQSGGHLAIETAPGAGTTVRLFLPRAPAATPALPEQGGAPGTTGHRMPCPPADDGSRMTGQLQ